MSEFEKYPINIPVTRSKTPLPEIFKQNVSEASNVNNRNAPLFNRPAPASKKRKMEQAAHVKELHKLCKPLSINLDRLPQQVITKMLRKRDYHHHRSKTRNRWQKGFVDKKRKSKSEKITERSFETNKTQSSPEMKPNHIWGCCRMIPFDRNRFKSQKKFSINSMRDLSAEIPKLESTNDIPIPSTSKIDIDKQIEKPQTFFSDTELMSNSDEENCVCRRTIPYIRKTCYKSVINDQNDSSTQAGGSKNSPSHQTHNEEISKIDQNNTKTDESHSENKPIERNSIAQQESSESELSTFKKTDKIEEDSRKSDLDDSMEESSWFNSSMWKLKRRHRARRISSSDSSSDEQPKKKRKIESSENRDSSCSRTKQQPKIPIQGVRTLCPASCTNHTHHSNIFNFLYKKPKPIKEVRIVLRRLEDMENDPYVIRWRNKGIIKIEKIENEEDTDSESQDNFEEQRYYLMNDDGTMSSEPIPQEALYQLENYNIDNSQDFMRINSYNGQVIDVSKFFNNCLPQEEIVETNQSIYNPLNTISNKEVHEQIEFNPKVLLIRLETLVGALDSEYSASEIEILEEKYIDFLLNSNFSYDKQSQSFFNVYKRLQAKRMREKQIEHLKAFDQNQSEDNETSEDIDGREMNEDDISEANEIDNVTNATETDTVTSEANEMNDSDEEDDNPLVIALENEKEVEAIVHDWASDASAKSREVNDQLPSRYSTDSQSTDCQKAAPRDSIEFVTCESFEEPEPSNESHHISCRFCRVGFKSLHAYTQHKAGCSKNKKSIICSYCGTQYKCRRNLRSHIQSVHGYDGNSDKTTKSKTKTDKNTNKSKAGSNVKSSSVKSSSSSKVASVKVVPKKRLPLARNNLHCGVCNVAFETRESLFDHIYQHTERELQDAFNDATTRKRNEELWNEKIETSPNSKQKHGEKTENKEWANKYAQWKDSILYKNNGTEESTSGQNLTNPCEEITVCSSESEEVRKNEKEKENVQSLSSSPRTSVIKNTKAAEKETAIVKTVTMCPCHSNDTSTMVNGDMQIEMVLLCEICQVLFRRLECFEVHYRVNRLCNRDRSSRLPKLFCSSCKILLNSLPEMRRHLEKHAQINRQGHVTFLCNICKVMFFGIGSLFYSHWFNHNKDVNFIASRYSFPKLSIVPCMNITEKGNQNKKEEYLFVAEHVCRDCK